MERWVHPGGDDQQQANVPRQALPRSDLKDSRGCHHIITIVTSYKIDR